jgi:hypothetical protein
MFDFAAAEKAASKDNRPEARIAAVVLGATRAGKSYLAGTMPGKTLFLHTQGEDHGKYSAMLAGGKIVAVSIDIGDDGKVLGADSAYRRLLDILRDGTGMAKAGFQSIVIDGLTELEALIRTTSQWTTDCLAKGVHNGFAEPAATLKMIRPIMDALRTLQRDQGLHYYVTCLLMVKQTDEAGEILASEPKLTGYEVAAQLIPQFPDQILLGRMLNPAGAEAHRLQFGGKVTKTVKEKNGEIKKQAGFTPALQHVPSDDLPSTMKADMAVVLKLKQECIARIGKPKAKAKTTDTGDAE